MAITLGAITLPSGLVWVDETAWNPVAQSTTHTLSGALAVEEHTRTAGRPITLEGGRTGAWMSRTNMLSLLSALNTESTILTLTLHDASTYRVTPRRDGDTPPAVFSPLAEHSDPESADWYALERLSLTEIPA